MVFQAPAGLTVQPTLKRSMSRDLSGAVNGYPAPFTDFAATFASGLRAGVATDPISWPMPTWALRNLTTPDLEAVFTYLRLLPRRSGAADKPTVGLVTACTSSADCKAPQQCNVTAGECEGACDTTNPCPACQTCVANACVAPAPTSTCLTSGL
jgi:hypothetical protein